MSTNSPATNSPFPSFFEQVEPIVLFDPLAEFLGSSSNGQLSFNYTDIVKNAGHSCPTIAGSYLSLLYGLKALYPDSTPIRGDLRAFFQSSKTEGVTGVIANVFKQVLGVTEQTGFKGIAGQFVRHSLLEFNANMPSPWAIQRTDTGQIAQIWYHPEIIPPNPEQQILMKLILEQKANSDDKQLFGKLWQERVEKLLLGDVLENGVLKVELTK